MTIDARLSTSSRIVASTQQVSCALVDEVVILSLQTGEYYGLDPIAADIWNLVQETRTVADIRDALLAMYTGVTPAECSEHVMALLEEMLDLELVEIR
jgi:hypothetical protein